MVFIAFMVLVAIVLLGLGGTAIVSYVKSKNGKLRKIAADRGLALAEAHKTLRTIANGAGNPALEAQITLDNYNSKEIL